jgi:small subunit ribosomal protein S13
MLKLNHLRKVKDLTDEDIAALRAQIDKCTVEGELRREVQMNIKNKMEINSYQGVRHKKGLPVRGQRTNRNARTRKGRGKTVANKKKVTK